MRGCLFKTLSRSVFIIYYFFYWNIKGQKAKFWISGVVVEFNTIHGMKEEEQQHQQLAYWSATEKDYYPVSLMTSILNQNK